MLQSMGSPRVIYDWVSEQQTESQQEGEAEGDRGSHRGRRDTGLCAKRSSGFTSVKDKGF